ncbi:amidase/aspartyl-tRNA(Asn)/glutamyl-tRNA(Gln) amidotransferase subunit A [Acinetobacter calcoaceticus]|uniref:Amidase/aspartyl-tRNA(Asn)/glutamyl-tRNA(Gln) amidotransferase subunit A n=1 Tax=Acinetobacter calcoaceticus TaxID=471 RepID=A0A4R1X8X7_ACICA|nr:amidase/aspartyl-tRNA(Asn)/glutamyl-tRNA(Gln) amidotransferase subunit A [Acinetobacter calcoaceticus]
MLRPLHSIEQLAAMHLDDLVVHYRAGVIDPVEVHDLTLAQIEQVNPQLHALYGFDSTVTRPLAEASARRWKNAKPLGMLDGVPVTIKDSIHAIGMQWHHGSAAHATGQRGQVDAPVVEKLKLQQAIIMSKTSMPDYGMSGSGVSSSHGIIRNPWNLSYSPGGSSAGAGASLAAGIGMISIGTDIAGSVRLPASHCALTAIKPTQGLIAHTPASDIRSAGIMARSAADLSTPLKLLAGVHALDRYSLPLSPMQPILGARVKCYSDFGFGPQVEAEVVAVLEQASLLLAQQGFNVDAGQFRYDFDAYQSIDDVFKLRAWNEYIHADASYRDLTPAALRQWFQPASSWSAAKVCQFQADVAKGVLQTQQLFEDSDFIMTPVMTVVNFLAEELGPDPSMPLRHCSFTAPFNQSGHPAVVIHAGFSALGLPIGLQLVGKRCSDLQLIELAVILEQALKDQGLAVHWPLWPKR